MPKNIRANIETGAQIVIAIAVLVIAAMVVQRYRFPSQVKTESMQELGNRLIGTRISVPNVDWEANSKSFILFLKKDCVYCKASAPFYRDLIKDASQRNVKSMAILPDTLEDARAYLLSLELPIENVQSAPLSAYRVPATPAAMFVDNQGVIKTVLVGASPNREAEMREQFIALFDGKSPTKH